MKQRDEKMPENNTIYLRTHTGRTEISEKACGLTQSERQVLILIDGVTPYNGLVKKLERLKQERVARAIDTLQQKGLICEVLLPVEDQPAEELDASVVERFLHQDPMDPVTIISFHPEDEFDESGSSPPAEIRPVEVPAVPVLEEWIAAAPTAGSPAESSQTLVHEADSDIVTDEQVAELAFQVRERQHARPQVQHTAKHIGVAVSAGQALDMEEVAWRRWEYWLIGTGLTLIVGSAMLR